MKGNVSLKTDDVQIIQVQHTKLLGVQIDEGLT